MNRIVFPLVALGISAGAMWVTGATLPTTAPATTTSQPTTKPRSDLPGLKNFAQIAPGLYRGAQPTAEGFKELEKMGVKTVINLRALHDDTEAIRGTSLRCIAIPCNAWHPEKEDVVAFLKAVSDEKNGPVFVHCKQGSDRTGMMIAAYRIHEQHWTEDEALAELPLFGFHEVFATIREHIRKWDLEKSDLDGK